MENISTTPNTAYDPSKDLNSMTCTDKSLNPVYVYEAAKDVNADTSLLDTSILNETEYVEE